MLRFQFLLPALFFIGMFNEMLNFIKLSFPGHEYQSWFWDASLLPETSWGYILSLAIPSASVLFLGELGQHLDLVFFTKKDPQIKEALS